MPERVIKALIFDMDGVLVDSEPLHLLAFQELMKEFGVTFTAEDNHAFLGRTDLSLAQFTAEKHGLTEAPESMVQRKENILARLIKEQAKARPGVMDLLETGKRLNLPMAVASSATMQTIQLVVDTLNIRGYFHNLTSGEEVAESKPAPDVFLLAAKRLNMPPENCLVVEDTYNGLQAARSAGMKCLVVPCDATRHQDHSAADLLLDSLEQFELQDWLHQTIIP
jgi:beta-phosphoglucomutase family hydrolase